MAPPLKVSNEDIVMALRVWGGDKTHAARDLGIRRASLYERMERMGITSEDFQDVTISSSGVSVEHSSPPIPDAPGIDHRVRDTHPAPWSTKTIGDKLDSVIDKVGAAAEDAGVFLRKRAQQSPRMKPEHAKELTRMRLTFQSEVGHEVSNDWVLEFLWVKHRATLQAELSEYAAEMAADKEAK